MGKMAVMNSMSPGIMVTETDMNMATRTKNVASAMQQIGMTLAGMVARQLSQATAFGTGCRSRKIAMQHDKAGVKAPVFLFCERGAGFALARG